MDQEQAAGGGDSEIARKLAEQLGQFTEAEFRALAGITASTCEAWRKRHQGPAWARIGRNVYYPRQAVVDFLAARLRGTRTPAGTIL